MVLEVGENKDYCNVDHCNACRQTKTGPQCRFKIGIGDTTNATIEEIEEILKKGRDAGCDAQERILEVVQKTHNRTP